MDVTKIPSQSNIAATRQSSDPSNELQRLQQQKELLTDQLTTLQQQRQQGMQVDDDLEEKLEKQIDELDKQIAAVQKQMNANATSEQPAQQSSAGKYDVFEKTAKNEQVNPAGIYRLEQGEDGEPKLVYDKPQAEKVQTEQQSQKVNKEDETEKADRQQLQQQKQQLTTELAQAAGDEDKTAQLQKGLAAVEAQLSLGWKQGKNKQGGHHILIWGPAFVL